MPDDSKYDSGHAILPVLHPSGDVHDIAIPEDAELKDLHPALSAAGYVFDQKQPTPEDTIEESPEFQAANRRIFDSMNHGAKKGENAAYLDQNKNFTLAGEQFDESATGGRQMHLNIPDGTIALSHVHPDLGQPPLSPADIKVMRNHHLPVYAVSKNGLWTIDGDGKPYQVFKGTDWMSKDFQGDLKFNQGIVSGHYTIRYEQDGKERTLDAGDVKNGYPIEAMKKLKDSGAKKVQTFGPGELKRK
jgi:hypothetical protein